MTLPNPPKKGVAYDIMQRCKQAAQETLMPFIQLIGDQPVYALIVEVKNKNQGDYILEVYKITSSSWRLSYPSCLYGYHV